MMGMKTIYNRMFLKRFMYSVYKTFNVRKMLQMNIIMSEWGQRSNSIYIILCLKL